VKDEGVWKYITLGKTEEMICQTPQFFANNATKRRVLTAHRALYQNPLVKRQSRRLWKEPLISANVPAIKAAIRIQGNGFRSVCFIQYLFWMWKMENLTFSPEWGQTYRKTKN